MRGKGKARNGKRAGPKGKRNGGARPATRSEATRVLATGVGATPGRAFGSTRGNGHYSCWDAKHPAHMALPRAVGPYTTIRATRRIQTTARANILGTFKSVSSAVQRQWCETVMVNDLRFNDPINASPANAHRTTVELGGLGEAATLVPSAFTVQVMCPTALQTASGIIYAGVMNTQAQIANRPEDWVSFMEKFVQFQNPRLLAASKLALRGVQLNSFPLNMTEVSEFTELAKLTDSDFVYATVAEECTGWAPIVIYNPSATNLELLITVEYRVRFDLDHPASAGHQYHPPATEAMWDKMSRYAAALGNGCVDIADVVATAGQVARAVGPVLPALAAA